MNAVRAFVGVAAVSSAATGMALTVIVTVATFDNVAIRRGVNVHAMEAGNG